MATTTKKSRAKTKTIKKPVTKAAKTTKKSVATTAAKITKTQKPFTEQLRRLNLASGVLGILLAAAAGFLMNNSSYQLFTGLLTTDELAGKTSAIFVPAIHSVFDLQLRWAVVTILLISAVVPLLAATRNRKQYEESLVKKVMLWRWIDMAVVSALILEVIAILSGVQDIMTLKLVGGLMLTTCLLGWLSEKHQAKTRGGGRGVFILSLFTGTLPWVLIAVSAIGTLVYGMVRSPWYVYALYATTLVAFMSYGLNGSRRLKAQQSYETTERNYQLAGIFAKTAFAVILIVGLYKK